MKPKTRKANDPIPDKAGLYLTVDGEIVDEDGNDVKEFLRQFFMSMVKEDEAIPFGIGISIVRHEAFKQIHEDAMLARQWGA